MTGERIGIGLLCAAACFWLAFIWCWEPAYLTLTVDDAFYYLVIARRAANGEGITFDGLVPTNGFHPLWLAVSTGIAGLVGPDTARLMRSMLSVQVLLVLFGTAVLSRARQIGVSRYALIFALVWLHFYVAKIVVNGQESALQYALLCVTLVCWWRGVSGYVVGMLAGLLTLARLDAVVMGIALAAMPIVWPVHHGTRLHESGRVAFPFVAVVLAYLVWSKVLFGHPLPVHVVLKSEWPGAPTVPAVVGATCIGLLLLVFVVLGRRARSDFLRGVLPVAVYAGAVLAYAWIRGRWIPEIWHFVPFLVLGVLVASFAAERYAQRRLFRVAGGVVAVVFVGAMIAGWSLRMIPSSYAPYLAARRAGLWLAQHTREASVAAGWDCGIAAAHSNRRFIHLEGLVNGWQFKEAFLDRGMVDRYLDRMHVEHIVQPFDVRVVRHGGVRMVGGVSLGTWRVDHAQCVRFTSGWSPAAERRRVHVVLSRSGRGPTLDAAGPTLCSRVWMPR